MDSEKPDTENAFSQPSLPKNITSIVFEDTKDKGTAVLKDAASNTPDLPLSPEDDPSSPSYIRIKLTRLEFALVFFGLVLSKFLSALDQTIVATAIPAIVSEFQALDSLAWVGTAFLLTTASFSPLYGKLADTFGRKPILLLALAIFEIGSVICGAATSMNMLIVGRAIAGAGGAGIFSLVLIIVSDIVSLQDRGKYQGILGATFGLASVAGPLLGGVFTDNLSWRWCFYINLPIGAITVAAVVAFLRFPSPKGDIWEKIKKIDFMGAIIIMSAVICLLIPMQYGGNTWAWSDWRTVLMFAASAVLLVVFALFEKYLAKDPILPPSMFENISVCMLLLVAIFLGASFLGLVYYLPSYFQLVNGDSATQAGLETIPLIGGVVFMSITSGQLVSRFGYYTPFIFVGSVVLTVGAALCSTLTEESSRAQQVLYLLVAGLGIGSMIQIRIIGVQASVSHQNIAVATSVSNLCQTLGGAISVAIVGNIFSNKLDSVLDKDLAIIVQNDPSIVHSLPLAMRSQAIRGFSDAFDLSLKAIIPMGAIIFFFALFIKQSKPSSRDNKNNVTVFDE